jgi:hypothetical protein
MESGDPAAAMGKKAAASSLKAHVKREGGIALCNLDLSRFLNCPVSVSTVVWLHANSNKQEMELKEELQGLRNTIRSIKSQAERKKGEAGVEWHDNDDNQPSYIGKHRANANVLEKLNVSCGGCCTTAWSVLSSVASTLPDGDNMLDPLDLLPASMGERMTARTLMMTRARDLIVASVKRKRLSKEKQALIAAHCGLFAPSMEENPDQGNELVKQVCIKCLELDHKRTCVQQAVDNRDAFDVCSMQSGAINVGKNVACRAGPGVLEERKQMAAQSSDWILGMR